MISSKRLLWAMAAAWMISAAWSADRPNIIVILSDDMGYSDIGCYGGEIKTPTLDSLAAQGKKFSQFYNTARCCPSRASLLTGLYPHQAGVGHLIYDTGHIGYGDFLTSDSVTIAEALHQAGYGTYMAGKWHLSPRSYDSSKDTKYWPTSRGFDKFYGTIAGSGSFYDPGTLCRDTTFISPLADPEYKPENYYYTDAITDNAIRYVNDHLTQKANKPFFLYMAYTAAHWPLQAPEDAIEPYKGKYAAGYEAIHQARIQRLKGLDLLPNLGDIAPAVGNWAEQKNKPAEQRLMETYAAMITRMDEGIGRMVANLKQHNQLDNTLILFLQDNGGCAEDPWPKPTHYDNSVTTIPDDQPQRRVAPPIITREGKQARTGHDEMAGPADVFVAYRENWANVSNTPFRKYKHFVHEGGISAPLIAYWPHAIHPTSSTQIVRQPAHLIDLMPTLLEAAGARYPKDRQGVAVQSMEGISLLPLLKDTGSAPRPQPLFWEHESNRAVRDGQWKLVAEGDNGPWELYDMDKDRGEMNNLAAQQPERVKTMAALWDAWAARSRVLPLGGWRDRRGKSPAPADTPQATRVELHQDQELPTKDSLNLENNGIHLQAEILEGPLEGVIVAQGASQAGFSLFMQEGKLKLARSGWGKGHREDVYPAALTAPFTVEVSASPRGRVQWKVTPNGGAPNTTITTKADGSSGFQKNPAQGISAGFDSETPVSKYGKEFRFQGKLGAITASVLSPK